MLYTEVISLTGFKKVRHKLEKVLIRAYLTFCRHLVKWSKLM